MKQLRSAWFQSNHPYASNGFAPDLISSPQPQGKDKHDNLNQLRMLDGGNKQPFSHINNHIDETNLI